MSIHYNNYNKKIKNHLLRQTNLCGICGKPILSMKEATIDHILPLSKGGSDKLDNLQIAHDFCNRKKGNNV